MGCRKPREVLDGYGVLVGPQYHVPDTEMTIRKYVGLLRRCVQKNLFKIKVKKTEREQDPL